MKTILYYLVLSVTCYFNPLGAEATQEKATETVETKISPALNLKSGFTDVIVLKSKEVKKFDMIEKAQQKYISKKYPNHNVILNMLFKDNNNRFIEVITLMNNEGEKAQIRFDMSEVYKSLKTKDKATKGKIEELESFYMDFNPKK